MKQNSLIVPIVGGGIAFLCFFFGGFVAAIGFIIALIGAWNISKSNVSMEAGAKDIQQGEEA